ncbi:MAG: hypothetical protein ACK5LL_02640 [Suipraeoptans sp.]
MVNLLIGPKGSGKTPDLIEDANQKEKVEHGSVIFIKKSHRNTKEINYKIRTICMDDYPAVTTLDQYVGFLYGIYSSNSDISQMFIDETLKIKDISIADIEDFIALLKDMSTEYNIDFSVSLSATKEEMKNIDTSQCNVINYP